MSSENSCPFSSDHGKDFFKKLGIVSKDGQCAGISCPVLKDYIEKKRAEGGDIKDCPFLSNHNCPFFQKMIDMYKA